jgi:hypothetical protein
LKIFFYPLIFTLYLFAFQNANAQSASETVVGTAGDFATFANGSMSWTIGEVITETYSATGTIFTQGFNQPDTMYLTAVSEQASQLITVYPNPVIDNLVVDLSLTAGNFYVQIIDTQGQKVLQEIISSNQSHLELSFHGFAEGIYLLEMINTETQIKTSYKINKIK